MALSRTNLYGNKSSRTAGTAAWSTGAFTPANSSLLVVCLARSVVDYTGDPGEATISGGSLTYTAVGSCRGEASYACRLDVWTAPVATGASMTITFDDPSNRSISGYEAVALCYTGYNTGTPVTGYVTSGGTDIGNGAETLTLAAAPTADDESIIALFVDSRYTPASTFTGFTGIYEISYNNYDVSLVVASRTGSTSTSAVIADTMTASGSYYKSGALAFNVKCAAAAGPVIPVFMAQYRQRVN